VLLRERELSMATGRLAYPYIRQMAEEMMKELQGLRIYVYEIRNDFFGEMITVSGLLTGQDIQKQLRGKKLGERLLLPQNVLRSQEDVFLDDITVSDLEKTLQVKIDIVKSSGYDFVNSVIG
jgi:NifB/MoaA-like Fe-S oxidoreductase